MPISHNMILVAVFKYGENYRVVVEDAVVGVYKTRGEALRAAELAIERIR